MDTGALEALDILVDTHPLLHCHLYIVLVAERSEVLHISIVSTSVLLAFKHPSFSELLLYYTYLTIDTAQFSNVLNALLTMVQRLNTSVTRLNM